MAEKKSPKTASEFLDYLTDLFADVSYLSTEEIEDDLQEMGVDTKKAVKRVKNLVNEKLEEGGDKMTATEALQLKMGDEVVVKWSVNSQQETGLVTSVKEIGQHVLVEVKTPAGYGGYRPEQIVSVKASPQTRDPLQGILREFVEKIKPYLE